MKRAAGDRHLGKLGEGEEARAIAVVDVVIVVGNVVGESGGLCLDRWIGVKLEVLLGAIAEDRLGNWLRILPAEQRTVMLDQSFERLEGQVEAVEARIFPFELGHHAQRLGVVIEAALPGHRGIERALAGMAEGRVAEIVGERQRLGQILIDMKRAGDGAGDLRHFEAVGQPRAVMVAFVIDEDLRLVIQAAEGGRVQDAVAVAPVRRARRARWLGVQPAPARARIDGIRGNLAALVD